MSYVTIMILHTMEFKDLEIPLNYDFLPDQSNGVTRSIKFTQSFNIGCKEDFYK